MVVLVPIEWNLVVITIATMCFTFQQLEGH